MRVRLGVEGLHLAISRRAIERDRLVERVVRLEPHDARAAGGGSALELAEQTTADSEPANRVGDPHPLELGGLAVVKLQRTAADRLPAPRRDEGEPRRPPDPV